MNFDTLNILASPETTFNGFGLSFGEMNRNLKGFTFENS